MVDGYGSDGLPGLVPQALQSVDLPFDLAESYVTSSPVQEALAVVGVPRSLIQGWSEVAELADLPLRRVDWLLTTAQRALHQLTHTWDGDLAWLVEEEKSLRLLLFRQGVPEVDHALDDLDPLPASAPNRVLCRQVGRHLGRPGVGRSHKECCHEDQLPVGRPPAGW